MTRKKARIFLIGFIAAFTIAALVAGKAVAKKRSSIGLKFSLNDLNDLASKLQEKQAVEA